MDSLAELIATSQMFERPPWKGHEWNRFLKNASIARVIPYLRTMAPT